MRKQLVALSLAVSIMLLATPVSSLPATEVEKGMLFGGQWTPVGNASSNIQNLSDLPAVVEVFTATWCENCVDVEHALDEVEAAGLLQQYHVHRFIGETQDPFGTLDLDSRWKEKYGWHSPPGVVFNGTMQKIGSVSDDGTLENEFTNLSKRDLGLGQGTTSFTWTPINNASGTLAWNLDIAEEHLVNATLNVSAWVVEVGADFDEGSNGLGTYPHILRSIQVIGNELQGSSTVSIPSAFDGNDLEVHLIYEVVPTEPEVVEETVEDEEEVDTPALSVIATLAMLGLAVSVSQKGRQDL